jgi:two-component system, OmpR family, sensor kinase
VGRLFWKFFLFTWLAQLLGIVGIALVFWLEEPRFGEPPAPPVVHAPPPPPGLGPPPGEPPRGRPPHRGPRTWPPPGPTLATLLASLLAAALLARYVAKPIRSLRLAFEAASGGRLDHRVAPLIGGRQDELADLGREFDRMAERLQDSMGRQRRLLHDVSHEVRSPLARLQAAVGLLRQKGSAEGDTVDRIEEEITRIDRLVGDLLRLSRIEAGDLAEAAEEVDLYELVSQVVRDASFETRGDKRRIDWTSRAEASLIGRPEMLHVAFENILRNALKHAPESELVTVETAVDASTSRFRFRVLDSGPGVRDEDLGRLFTPFFRTDRAASTEGYGLGLAIARRSIEAHGGAIRARNRTGGGLSVEIELPLGAGGDSIRADRPDG